jgi:glycosyltransferase involved in cell wall biosynthesis
MISRTILLIGNHFITSIHTQHIWHEFASRLNELGWKVIITSEKVQRVPRLFDMLYTIWRRRSDYMIAEIDVFSGSAFTWAEYSARLLKLLHKPFILILHGGNLPEYANKHPRHVRPVIQAAHAVVTPSSYLYDAMRRYREDIQVIPNPIDLQRYIYRQRDTASPRLIWLRAFHEIYNPSIAPKVVKELSREFPKLSLIMVGSDKGDGSLQTLQNIVKDLEIENCIETPGGIPHDQVPEWLNKGDIFLNTTNYDNTPLSVIEAMACGLCIVSTDVGGIPYLLEHEIDALLVPPDDPTAMAAAVRRILTEPDLAQRLSENARQKAEGFDWSVVLPQWEELLTELIAT